MHKKHSLGNIRQHCSSHNELKLNRQRFTIIEKDKQHIRSIFFLQTSQIQTTSHRKGI